MTAMTAITEEDRAYIEREASIIHEALKIAHRMDIMRQGSTMKMDHPLDEDVAHYVYKICQPLDKTWRMIRAGNRPDGKVIAVIRYR